VASLGGVPAASIALPGSSKAYRLVVVAKDNSQLYLAIARANQAFTDSIRSSIAVPSLDQSSKMSNLIARKLEGHWQPLQHSLASPLHGFWFCRPTIMCLKSCQISPGPCPSCPKTSFEPSHSCENIQNTLGADTYKTFAMVGPE
jgi:hypothetical protein